MLRSRPNVLLVLIAAAHRLDDLLAFLGRESTLLGDDLAEHDVDFARHVCRVSADVEIGLLEEQLVDLGGALLESVLDVFLLGLFAREGCDEFECGAEGFGKGL